MTDWCIVADFLDRWQALIAGVVGFVAAIAAVWMTLRSEARRERRELVSLKRALSAEIFQLAGNAFEAHQRIRKSADIKGITVHELEDAIRFPDPVIYPNTAGRIGQLSDRAYEIVLFYSRIRSLRETVLRIRRDSEERNAGAAAQTTAIIRGVMGQAKAAEMLTAAFKIGIENTNDAARELLAAVDGVLGALTDLAAGTVDAGPIAKFRAAVEEAKIVAAGIVRTSP